MSAPILARLALGFALAVPAAAGGGPLGIDHRVNRDEHGPWNRKVQLGLADAVVLAELGGALWEGGESRLGRTFWAAVDASALSALTVQAAKRGFGRSRPSQTPDPDRWFQGPGHESFPSGEVALQASFVAPFVAEYGTDHPWVWSLAALPAYDAIARVKSRGHWQTDVLAGLGVGAAWGIWADDRRTPLILTVLPGGVGVGLRKRF